MCQEKAENKKIEDRKTANLWVKSYTLFHGGKVIAIVKTQEEMKCPPS